MKKFKTYIRAINIKTGKEETFKGPDVQAKSLQEARQHLTDLRMDYCFLADELENNKEPCLVNDLEKHMSIEIYDYLNKCKNVLKKLEKEEHYNQCAYVSKIIKSIEEGDEESYIVLNFDIPGLIKNGFLEKEDVILSKAKIKLKKFFDIDSIFEYSLISGAVITSLEERQSS